ncbi:MAG TPA: sigma-70 family RNA polymerase sigma factor [Thermotogota bacterium]|nr:sigma-70 family RNA polymerase sigma factor [Thermotogota bacterium]HRW93182.1 sigma-70 family RNA polymerase sigma factor [Thermotogota bacterium]
MIEYRLRKLRINELVGYAQDGVHEALALIVERYAHMVMRLANQYFGTWAEKSDIIQNGYVGLLKAVYYYRDDREANFNTFAWTNIHSEIKTFLTFLNRKKNQVLSDSMSIDATFPGREEEEDGSYYLEDPSTAEENTFLKEFLIEKVMAQLLQALSPLERKIFELYLMSMTYEEIGEALQIKSKKVDNVIQKCRKKIKVLFREENSFVENSQEWIRRWS